MNPYKIIDGVYNEKKVCDVLHTGDFWIRVHQCVIDLKLTKVVAR